MGKIVAFVCLHYGSDYLGYAVKSVYDSVDKICVAYSPKPSHGHGTNKPNPDSRQAIRDSLFMFGDPQGKIDWVEGTYQHEGIHRKVVWDRYPGAEMIAVVDADEIWHPHEFAAMKEWVLKQPQRNFKQALRTLWRSFSWICDDPMLPDRFYRPKGNGMTFTPSEIGIFYHFGYAREPKHIKYKLEIHGHKGELKPGWFDNKFMKWSPENRIGDLHPTCTQQPGSWGWNAVPFDKMKLPKHLRQHPYWDLKIITNQ